MDTRSSDMEILRNASRSSDATTRRQAEVAMERIKHEGKEVRSMREALIKAHRSGDTEEIKDIHDYIKERPEYHTWGKHKAWR